MKHCDSTDIRTELKDQKEIVILYLTDLMFRSEKKYIHSGSSHSFFHNHMKEVEKMGNSVIRD